MSDGFLLGAVLENRGLMTKGTVNAASILGGSLAVALMLGFPEPSRVDVGLCVGARTIGHAAAALLLVLLMVATTSLTGYALAEEDEGYPDGHEEWRVDDLMRLYVEGLNQEEASSNATAPMEQWALRGPRRFRRSAGLQRLVTSSGQPHRSHGEHVRVLLRAARAGACALVPPRTPSRTGARNVAAHGSAGGKFDLHLNGSAGHRGRVERRFGALRRRALGVNLSMQPGEAFTLSLWMQHDCEGTRARVLWGGFEQNAGGIVIEGDIYEPSATLKVDASRRAPSRVRRRPSMGCRRHRLGRRRPCRDVVHLGPLEDDELFTRDGDFLVETSTGRVLIDRVLPGNNTAWTWTGVKEMPIGHVGLEICVTVVGSTPTRIAMPRVTCERLSKSLMQVLPHPVCG